MNIIINGRFLSQATTGIQRVGREFLHALDMLIDAGTITDVQARVVAPPDARVADLALRRIGVKRVGKLRGHAWEQLVLPRHVGDARLICLGNVAPVETLVQHQGGSVALMLHDMSYRKYPDAYRRVYRYGHAAISPILLRYANPIITVSHSEREQITDHAPGTSDRIVVAQNGCWRDDVRPTDLPSWTHRRAHGHGLYVGSFSSRKNIDAIFDIAVFLAREKGMRFVFVGSPSPTLSATKHELPSDVGDMIDLRGQIETPEALEQIYRNAACLVFPSFYEASPLPPVEAMTFGCPVIASDIPAMRERCGDAAIYCDPTDRSSIRGAVERVLDESGLAERLINAGFAQASLFSWRDQALLMIDAIRNTGGRG